MRGEIVRKIKSIEVISKLGVRRYRVGDEVNGLEIKRIEDCGVDSEVAFHTGFRCMGEKISDYIVEIWDAPVIVEYYETEATP